MRNYFVLINILTALLLAGLFFFGNGTLFVLAYIAEWLIISARTLVGNARKRIKLVMITVYFWVMIFQITICLSAVFSEDLFAAPLYTVFLYKAFGILVFFIPLIINRYISAGKYASFYLPSVTEVATVSFAELQDIMETLNQTVAMIQETSGKITRESMKEIIEDLPRHDSFSYINNGSLTEAYFAKARESLDDQGLYIVISRTGSAASELISVFTQKEYNHASLSFDKDLATIISYNGGERFYPPGLNYEMLEFFNKTEGSSIMVYRLPATREQKQKILDKVEEINREGSAYNMMGLVLKYSHKPNIMFCSQFVYNMLKFAGIEYFAKRGANVKPTDLIELDYYKKLEFVYEIKFDKTR